MMMKPKNFQGEKKKNEDVLVDHQHVHSDV